MAKQSRLPSFLLTRPATQAGRFGAMLRERFGAGVQIVDSPLIAPRFLTPEIPRRPYRALIFTSETGVQGFQRLSADPILNAIPEAWCVGDRTAHAGTEAGLIVRSAKGDVTTLQAAIVAAHQMGPLLYLHGQDLSGNLAKSLNLAGIETLSAVVYSQEPQNLSPAAVNLLGLAKPVILPLFSPRTAALFVVEWKKQNPRAQLLVVAMSDAVAQVAQSLPYLKMVVALRPNAAAMLEAIEEIIATAPDA